MSGLDVEQWSRLAASPWPEAPAAKLTRLVHREGAMNFPDIQEQLKETISRAHVLNTRAFEECDAAELRCGLVEPLAAIVQGGLAILSEVLTHYDSEEPLLPERRESTGDFDKRLDSVMQRPESARRIGDLAFMARMELRERTDALVNLPRDCDQWSVIAAAASIRRKIEKSFAAVETSIAEHEKVPSLTQGIFETELQRSLSVRRAYTRFRHQIEATLPKDASDARGALRMASVAFARLLGLDIYEYLRVEDRILLRCLQHRLLALLADPESGGLPALRLYQEIFAFAGLLRQVNNRAALREHDRSLSAEVLSLLAGADEVALDAALLSRLMPLVGRDDEVDAFLRNKHGHSNGECRGLLERLVRELGGGSGVAGAAALQGDVL